MLAMVVRALLVATLLPAFQQKQYPLQPASRLLTPSSMRVNESSKGTPDWTILVCISEDFWKFFDNWFHYYSKLNLGMNIVMVAEDASTVDRYSKTSGVEVLDGDEIRVRMDAVESNDANQLWAWGDADYKTLVMKRPDRILFFLYQGINVLYTDVDVVWREDPRPFFTADKTHGKMPIAWAPYKMIGERCHEKQCHEFCTGLLAMPANNETFQLVTQWSNVLHKHEGDGKFPSDQEAFNQIAIWQRNDDPVSALPREQFPSGLEYFDEDRYPDWPRDEAVVVHANWMKEKEKEAALQRVGLWMS